MKRIIINFTGAVLAYSSIGVAAAGDKASSYIYYPDGSYRQQGSGAINHPSQQGDEVPGNRSPEAGVGFIESTGGYYFNSDIDDDASSFGLRGSYARSVGSQWTFQADASYEFIDVSNGDVDEAGLTLHVSRNLDDKFAVGAFVHAGFVGEDFWEQYRGGLEAAAFRDRFTLYGRVAYEERTFANITEDDVTGTLGARIYANDNLRFDVEGKYQEDFVSATVAGNFRMPKFGTTFSLGYRYNADIAGSQTDGNSLVFSALRYHFGSDSLRDEERNGLTWSFQQ